MSDPAKDDALQFDKAEWNPAAGPVGGAACVFCRKALKRYWAVGGQLACGGCHERVVFTLEGGSGLERIARAGLYGSVAAVLGAVLWYVVVRVTGLQLGLVAVACGWLVGSGVSAGSARSFFARGGWPYQVLALGLTYLAVAGAHIPILARSQLYFDTHPGTTSVSFEAVLPLQPEPLYYLFAAPLSLIHPFNDDLLGILIVCFGLYEAWRLNALRVVPITGPHDVGPGLPPPAPGAEPQVPTA